MKIILAKDYKELSEKASEIIISEIRHNPNITIGFATGKTPLKTYRNLIKAYKKNKVNFSKIKTFNLDEYYPIKKDDKRSYSYYMFNNLFNKINVKKENIHLLDGNSKKPDKECKYYEENIKKNPIDIQILGIGVNGHVAFNEPGSQEDSKTRLVELTHIKGKALTMGISTIMKSKKLLLLASGKKKAKVVLDLIKGKPSKNLPASFLKKHKNITLIIDKKAGSLI
ncbi:MAG: glucosamine-6-phosphate deaminase [Nanobdellota archaeon]